MILDTLRQQTLAASLSATRESGAATLRFHARAKPMLAFARPFGWLVGAFHLPTKWMGKVEITLPLSTTVVGHSMNRESLPG